MKGMKAKMLMCVLAAGLVGGAGKMAYGKGVAHFSTGQGEFDVVLDVAGRPRAVAAFAGLADGSLAWVDMGTGAVRGGDGEDAFYAGFEGTRVVDGVALFGGTREVGEGKRAGTGMSMPTDAGGMFEVREGAMGFAVDWGYFATPFEGEGGLGFWLTNAVSTWPVFGQVAEDGLGAFHAWAAAVASTNGTGGGKGAAITLDWSGLTAEESNALEAARAMLPRARGVETRFGASYKELKLTVPARAQALVSWGTNLAEWTVSRWGWNESTNGWAVTQGWGDFGGSATADRGFVGFDAVEYPAMGGNGLEGRWQLWVDFGGGVGYRLWADFAARTGTVDLVESGTVTWQTAVGELRVYREGAESVRVYCAKGADTYSFFLRTPGVLGDGATGTVSAVFYNPLSGEGGKSFGMYEVVEGWERKKGAPRMGRTRNPQGGRMLVELEKRTAEAARRQ